MTSKETIFERIRQHTHMQFDKPVQSFRTQTFPDKLASFIAAIRGTAGEVTELLPGEDVNDVILRHYPDAKRIASNLPEITCATFNPDDVADARDLNGTDLSIVKGEFGVIENGAVWLKKSVRHKAVYFISEALVILLDKNRLVDTMHEAYVQPEFDTFDFGVFISGPSKTADIEQALVVGAHGAKEVTVILI